MRKKRWLIVLAIIILLGLFLTGVFLSQLENNIKNAKIKTIIPTLLTVGEGADNSLHVTLLFLDDNNHFNGVKIP
jgi:uncharacterized alpha/beta hydrolase family protein